MTDVPLRSLAGPQLLHTGAAPMIGTNSINTEERRKRQNAVKHARASVGLEGFKPSEVCEQQAARFIAGEIDLPEFLKPAR